ncbi:PREDICTED: uncharacterized protein LOC109168200 [Ipomoea nil]|uniref:uncharacterized protein LOC109168200 n=1 Tax=Ipomoea nil TaxID=35883 RepID=UPI000901A5AF|nr:PREDICTED: uncharacterized protein LOC109168200 [Ipomoea nil]
MAEEVVEAVESGVIREVDGGGVCGIRGEARTLQGSFHSRFGSFNCLWFVVIQFVSSIRDCEFEFVDGGDSGSGRHYDSSCSRFYDSKIQTLKVICHRPCARCHGCRDGRCGRGCTCDALRGC